MTIQAEILFEGTYHYFQAGVNYAQENFKLVYNENLQVYHIYAEILSRVETGEFLKVLVRYEMNAHFVPYFVRIEKSIGNKYAQEVFKFDLTSQVLHYTFQNAQDTQEFTKTFSPKHYLTSPAFSTATMFSLTKRFDATGRTPLVLIGTSNEWTYQGPPEEKMIYAEFKTREVQNFQLNGQALSASHLCLFEHDALLTTQEEAVDIFVSKHYALPYQMLHGNQKIIVKHLKKLT
jgi:hypothetical protein